jgi:hypothetical protein
MDHGQPPQSEVWVNATAFVGEVDGPLQSHGSIPPKPFVRVFFLLRNRRAYRQRSGGIEAMGKIAKFGPSAALLCNLA